MTKSNTWKPRTDAPAVTEWVRQAKYAQIKGVSRQRVAALIRDGKLPVKIIYGITLTRDRV